MSSSLHKLKPILVRALKLFLIPSLLVFSSVFAQPKGVTLLGHLDLPHGTAPQKTNYSACWGYVSPDGKEYGFISTYTGMEVVDLNGDTMREVAFIPGPTSAYCYREIRTHLNYGYIVYDYPTAGEVIGMQIVDLSGLPDTVVLLKTFLYADSAFGNVGTSHTLEYSNGYLYCNGSTRYPPAGTVIFSLRNDPTSPEFAGAYEPAYIHDAYIRNDTMYGAAIYSGGGLFIADVRNKSSPLTLGKIVYPGSGTHNAWSTLDSRYVFTTDEVGTTNHDLKVWALDSLPNSVKVAEWSADPTTSIHNVYVRGNYLYAAHYKAGFRVLDIHDPTNPAEAGFYDTYQPAVDSVLSPYAGCWGAFPFFPSGRIIASDMQTGLYLFRFDNLKPRTRVRLLQSRDSASSQALNFRWTSAANQSVDPVWYDIHIRQTGGGSFDSTFPTKDTSFANLSLLNFAEGDYAWFVTLRDEFTAVNSIDTLRFHVPGDRPLPQVFNLMQNYPNPFNPDTKIEFSLPNASRVELKVYTILGEQVRSILNGEFLPAGNYVVKFNGADIASGTYFYRMITPSFTQTRRMSFSK
ncbi:MAG TPA: choice-of-anchor B family protein [Bacteroidota bacterium]|nr:choice-of-anchor B family protein [Bacteroidota bacterium]